MRIGDYVVRHTDGIVDYLYRMDNPKKVYRTKGVLTVKAAQIRSARKKLENVIV
jgi:hypothetical protein